jgi:hypothetical protein
MVVAGRLAALLALSLLACGGGDGATAERRSDETAPGSGASSPPPRPGGGGTVPGGGTSSGRACSAVRPPWPAGRAAGYRSPIAAENAHVGERLVLGTNADAAGERRLEVYTGRASARAGDRVEVMVRAATAGPIRWRLFRLGWYGGLGARRVSSGTASAGPQPACPMEASTGLVRCSWAPAFSLPFGAEHVSGYHVLQVQRDEGGATWSAHAPLVVVDERAADLLVQAGTNTWQAYNDYGGESLYVDRSGTLAAQGSKAVKVSYDRPYAGTGLPSRLLRYEATFARWAERAGYDVTYTTTFDAALGGCAGIARAGMFVQVGHDEYTPGALRAALDEARDAGVPQAYLSGNPLYWKVRMEDFADPRSPRTIAVYKAFPANDPDRAEPTGRWRDAVIDHPENALAGVLYGGWQVAYFPLVVTDASSWLFRGTGVRAGDAFPGLVGHEYDWRDPHFRPHEPPGLTVHARSPLVDALGVPAVGEAVSHRAASGALVFAAGTIQWVYGLGQGASPDELLAHGPDPRVERMTANVIEEAIGVAMPAGPFAPPRPQPVVDPAPALAVRTVARGLLGPAGIAVATVPGVPGLPPGSLVVASARENRILAVDPASGAVSVLAGGGALGQTGGPLRSALFRNPTAVVQLPDGTLAVADGQNYAVRRVDLVAGRVTHLAGGGRLASGEPGRVSGYRDGPGDVALFNVVMGLAWDAARGRLLVADSGNGRVRAIAPDGSVTTVAGSGSASSVDGPALAGASIFYPTGVAVGGDGRIFVLSPTRIRAIADGRVTTIAGGEVQGFRDGTGAGAQLVAYGSLARSGDRLYFADAAGYRVREVALGAGEGRVRTIAGQGRLGDVDGAGDVALVGMPVSVAAGPDGTIYVTDAANGTVRAITPR